MWAAPKGADGRLDHNAALTGDDLRDFVNRHLFPYLAGFKQRASGPNTIEYKIGEVFGEIKNKVQSGYNLRDVIDLVDELRFGSQTEKHELSHLYEAKIRNMGNARRNGGEYPRQHLKSLNHATSSYNQIANYVIAQSEINIGIGARPPTTHFAEIRDQINGGAKKYGGITNREELLRNLQMNCIPETMIDGEVKDYEQFLEDRRRLMALKIKRWFEVL